MKPYTITWVAEADGELANIWLRAHDRADVTRASNRLEHELSRTPTKVGTEISAGLRIVEMDPLLVLFHVSEDDRLVTVQSVKYLH